MIIASETMARHEANELYRVARERPYEAQRNLPLSQGEAFEKPVL
jgi:hypothetical protein